MSSGESNAQSGKISPKYPSSSDNQPFAEKVSNETFNHWYEQREIARNIRNGTPYFNGSPTQQPPSNHTPSKLLRCQRRTYYQHYNAPQETENPRGIFWFGDKFETEVAVPFLRSIVTEEHFVRNSMWIDIETTVNDESIRIRGETDPVIVDQNSTPVVLTEIKTTSSVEYLDEPKQHHKAQVHAYQRGLANKFDCKPVDAIILYGERDSLEIKVFSFEFDPEFWESVTSWAATQTEYRHTETLPPADPEHEWECQYCPYQTRCGKGDSATRSGDAPVKGLVPLTKYPKSSLKSYLEGHEGAKLTPTTGAQHQDLADAYAVHDWYCECCGETIPFKAVDWDGNMGNLPQCPVCRAKGRPAELHDPPISDQWPQSLEQVEQNGGGSS